MFKKASILLVTLFVITSVQSHDTLDKMESIETDIAKTNIAKKVLTMADIADRIEKIDISATHKQGILAWIYNNKILAGSIATLALSATAGGVIYCTKNTTYGKPIASFYADHGGNWVAAQCDTAFTFSKNNPWIVGGGVGAVFFVIIILLYNLESDYDRVLLAKQAKKLSSFDTHKDSKLQLKINIIKE